MRAQAFNSSTWGTEASLIYRVSSWTTRATEEKPVSKNQKQNQSPPQRGQFKPLLLIISMGMFVFGKNKWSYNRQDFTFNSLKIQNWEQESKLNLSESCVIVLEKIGWDHRSRRLADSNVILRLAYEAEDFAYASNRKKG